MAETAAPAPRDGGEEDEQPVRQPEHVGHSHAADGKGGCGRQPRREVREVEEEWCHEEGLTEVVRAGDGRECNEEHPTEQRRRVLHRRRQAREHPIVRGALGDCARDVERTGRDVGTSEGEFELTREATDQVELQHERQGEAIGIQEGRDDAPRLRERHLERRGEADGGGRQPLALHKASRHDCGSEERLGHRARRHFPRSSLPRSRVGRQSSGHLG